MSSSSNILSFLDFDSTQKLLEEGRVLAENDMDENWLFVYEALKKSELKDNWKTIKNIDVSFLLPEYRYL